MLATMEPVTHEEASRLKSPEVQGLLADFPDAAELLDVVAGFTHNPLPTEEDNLITFPTITVVTTISTVPW